MLSLLVSIHFDVDLSESTIGFCFSALSMEINDNKVSAQVALSYLATTSAGMGFGLLCITIASLVSKDFHQ